MTHQVSNIVLSHTTQSMNPITTHSKGVRIKSLLLALPLLAALAIPAAASTALQTSGTLQLPQPCVNGFGAACGVTPPGKFPTITNPSGPFTGTWSNPVAAPWLGYFTGTGGPYPSGASGTTQWDFSYVGSTTGNGVLPSGTFVYFGDLDDGSGTNERFTLTAFDQFNQPITAAWLNSPFFVSSPNQGDRVQSSMPEYAWNGSSYDFDGNNVPGNPNIGVLLTTNMPIYGLKVVSYSDYDGFDLGAPTPEPASLLLLGSGLSALSFVRKRFMS